ncbi:hypothetical protein HAX39_24920 [Citrobacter freundii]|nr:hypothetical protein [Citrobacter freundii]
MERLFLIDPKMFRMALATIAGGGSMGFISLIQSHSRWESLSAAMERRTESILSRVIMERKP